MPIDRPRDASGKPRNARPRDGAGRPLSPGAPGVARVPDDFLLPPAEAVREAQRLIDAGQPFSAHEVLEGSWKAAPVPERELWRALAQLAVGLTHAQRGNTVGAQTLLLRGEAGLAAYDGTTPYGIPVRALRQQARALAALAIAGTAFDPVLALVGD